MPVNETRDFIFKNYYERIRFSKENSYYSMKRLKKQDLLFLANELTEKVPDPGNTKNQEKIKELSRKKNTKSIKQSKIITYQQKC